MIVNRSKGNDLGSSMMQEAEPDSRWVLVTPDGFFCCRNYNTISVGSFQVRSCYYTTDCAMNTENSGFFYPFAAVQFFPDDAMSVPVNAVVCIRVVFS